MKLERMRIIPIFAVLLLAGCPARRSTTLIIPPPCIKEAKLLDCDGNGKNCKKISLAYKGDCAGLDIEAARLSH